MSDEETEMVGVAPSNGAAPPPPPPPPKETKAQRKARLKARRERRKAREEKRQGKARNGRRKSQSVKQSTCGDGLHSYKFGVWSLCDYFRCLMCFPFNFCCCPPGNACKCTRCGHTETKVGGLLKIEEVKQYRETFDHLDIDQNGVIDEDELKTALRDLGDDPNIAGDLIRAIAPTSGQVRFRDFVRMMEHHQERKNDESKIMEDLKQMFDDTDLDGDGFITVEDLKLAMKKYQGHEYTARRIKRWLKVVDLNRDGRVDFDEFTRYWTKEYRKGHRFGWE